MSSFPYFQTLTTWVIGVFDVFNSQLQTFIDYYANANDVYFCGIKLLTWAYVLRTQIYYCCANLFCTVRPNILSGGYRPTLLMLLLSLPLSSSLLYLPLLSDLLSRNHSSPILSPPQSPLFCLCLCLFLPSASASASAYLVFVLVDRDAIWWNRFGSVPVDTKIVSDAFSSVSSSW